MTLMIRQIFRSRLNTRIMLSCVTLASMCLTVILPLPDTVPAADGSSKPAASVDALRLEGRWVRPDGGYVLELSNVGKDGTLTAVYLNPRPIRVSQAFWGTIEGSLRLFVELRDVNYPGSKYNLRYDPAADRLQGTYFQALERQTYAIEFRRKK